MANIFGSTTTYHGTEHAFMRGLRVRIVAVLKNRARPIGLAPDRDDDHVRDEADLARAGGVAADDRIEVQPWMEGEGRFSWVTSDAQAVDLASFRDLARASSAK